ncbi:MAG: Mu-like prophage major head subunit gpT family protein [Rhodospirillales bacterium]
MLWGKKNRAAPAQDITYLRDAGVKPTSVDEEARTAELVWSTGAEVRRSGLVDGPYLERLSMDPRHVDMRRLQNGNAPVLNGHRNGKAEDVIGIVVNARVEHGQGIATVRFSERADVEPIWRDIVAGIIRNVSVGYQVHEYKESRGDNGETVLTATRWEPMEISVVPVPADASSFIRSLDTAGTASLGNADETRERAAGIMDLAALAGHGTSVARSMFDRGLSIEDARKELLQMRDQNIASEPDTTNHLPANQHEVRGVVNWSGDDPNVRRSAMAEAIVSRVMPGQEPPEGMARQFMGRTMPELCRTILEWHGESTLGLSPATLVQRTMAGLHTSSDFQAVLGEVSNKTLRKGYDAAPSALKVIGRQSTARDFRDKHNVMVDGSGELAELNEHAEIPYTTITDSDETYKVKPFGIRFGLTFEAMVNDDLGALQNQFRLATKWARNTESKLLISALTDNAGLGPTMKADNKTLFHADHGNLAGSGGALGVDTLGAARNGMRQQTGLDGTDPINVTPKYLVVPSALETSSEQVLTAIQATKVSDVNPHAGKLELVVDPRLDAVSTAAWYLAADPYVFDTIEYAYLDGSSGPTVEAHRLFNKLGWEFRVLLFFGVGVIDWRGLYKNPGAGE